MQEATKVVLVEMVVQIVFTTCSRTVVTNSPQGDNSARGGIVSF